MLREGRATLPIAVAVQPIAVDDPRAGFVFAWTDEAGFHRLWAAALFHRCLDGYDATLLLWESGLDTEALAHCRIAFEHLLSFAWVVADRTDITRPLRIDRHGVGFAEKQVAEMASYTGLSERRPYQVGLALGVNTSDLPPPPGAQDLCSLLDDELLPRLEAMARTGMSFSAWYSRVYRGASAFVHPTPAGIDPLIERASGTIEIAPSRARPPGLLETVATQLRTVLHIANTAAPWLVEGRVP